MANICFTSYIFTGASDDLHALADLMQGLGEDRMIYTLLKALGTDPDEIYCRGEWCDLRIEEGVVRFSTQSAWRPLYQAIELLCRHFRALTYYYYAEEPGVGIYITNDVNGFYFPDRLTDDGCPIELANVLNTLTPYSKGDGMNRLVAFDGTELGTMIFKISK